MRRLFGPTLLIILVLLFTSGANAGKPSGEDNIYIGNGFPSGPHFNLNVIAKKAGFTCPEQQFLCSEGSTASPVTDCSDCPTTGTCTPLYGGSIFVPQVPAGDKITILMESGAKGPKGNITATSLEVTDSCTEAFDGGPAAFRLPADPDGYFVYARVVGDPKQNPQFDFTNPRFKYVMDESGNDLWFLGAVRDSLFDQNLVELPSRYDSNQKGKGVQKGVDITPLFLWSGDVCYLEQSDLLDYCDWVDDGDDILGPNESACTESTYCCINVDAYDDYEYCKSVQLGSTCDELVEPLNLCCDNTASEFLGPEQCKPGTAETCTDPSQLVYGPFNYETVTAFCKHYGTQDSGVWVFNIADFVGLLFDINSNVDNTGSSVIQLRFYPLPLNTK